MVQKSILIFATFGLVMAALVGAVATSNTSLAFPKGNDHKEMAFGAISSIKITKKESLHGYFLVTG